MAFENLALATRKGLLILSNKAGSSKVVHEGFPGAHVAISFLDRRNQNLFACISDGHFGTKIHRWTNFDFSAVAYSDSIETWQEIPAPKYPDGAKLQNGNDAVLKYPWAMATGHKNQNGRIYLGSEPGGMFVSDDNGDSFKLCEGLWNHPSRLDEKMPWMGGGLDNPAIHSIVVDPRDANRIRVGVSVAGVFETTDGGESWVPANKGLKAEFLPDPDVEVGHDPHMMVQCENTPEILWQQNHCGIFRTSDGCVHWEKVSEVDGPAHFGFAIAVDPNDGDTAWVVPAESDMVRAAVDRSMCVSRTTDGGKTWTAFRNGLPQDDCYDFVFRHCLHISGDSLIFGTACGKLYQSDDRGESWRTLCDQLPPIYCVTELV